MNVLKRALDARDNLLRYGNERNLLSLQILPSNPVKECVTKNALVFASIEEIFGIDAMKRFISTVATAKQWSGCLSNEELGNALFGATNSLVASK